MKKLLEKIRFKIANYLNNSKKYCWADLALFGMGYGFLKVFKRGGEACRIESETHQCNTCYCGKFYNGRLATAEDFKSVCNGPEKDKSPF